MKANSSLQTILLVEDDTNDVLLFQRAYRKCKLANPLQIVGDGEAAQDYLAGSGKYADRESYPLPALVLLDFKLPRMSGLEVLAWMRSQTSLKRVPVVALTSSRERSDVNRAYDLGINSYLVKPVAFDNLMQLVKALGLYWMIMNEHSDLAQAENA
ncbi:response regulator with CheY-like receiver domain and winged-helix DNA-binding domain [Sulfuricella denitrificans skB26]|uniref:Response regulator with CheY-like receiver domain and winged-helix DNA-binding domain n=1 Tax=Sulfuricella denitrificans (strain DSM 22764 / NBRC 105220 / skB26) TaxID=1163617 RepID=S6ACL0_SULDS|nr:response regulator [Sulfuricella denitrificans]BAN35673.1 response regulator with CheY-like receiver domain and winged-helix DNA-binding domain [Sulfuricella denitrificans skB26]